MTDACTVTQGLPIPDDFRNNHAILLAMAIKVRHTWAPTAPASERFVEKGWRMKSASLEPSDRGWRRIGFSQWVVATSSEMLVLTMRCSPTWQLISVCRACLRTCNGKFSLPHWSGATHVYTLCMDLPWVLYIF